MSFAPLNDELRIDTPEQVALELPIAGVGSRFLAIATDTVLQVVAYLAGVLVLIVIPAVAGLLARIAPGLVNMLQAALVLLGFVIYWGYFTAFEIAWKGQTPGKRLAGVRVIKEDGRPIDATSVILRNLIRVVDFLPALYAAGVTCMIVNRHSRRLGDLVAGTVVVHDRPPARLDATWLAGPASAPDDGLMAVHAARLTDAELLLVETYLHRRLELDAVSRARMGKAVTVRVSARTGLGPAPDQALDDFLETMARLARNSARAR